MSHYFKDLTPNEYPVLQEQASLLYFRRGWFTSLSGQAYLTNLRFVLYPKKSLEPREVELPLSCIKSILRSKRGLNHNLLVIHTINHQEYWLRLDFDQWILAFNQALSLTLHSQLVQLDENEWAVQTNSTLSSHSSPSSSSFSANIRTEVKDLAWATTYIRRYHEQLSRYEIDKHLIMTGYNPLVIQAAWQNLLNVPFTQQSKRTDLIKLPFGRIISGQLAFVTLVKVALIAGSVLVALTIWFYLTQPLYWKFRQDSVSPILLVALPVLLIAVFNLVSKPRWFSFANLTKHFPMFTFYGLCLVGACIAVSWLLRHSNDYHHSNSPSYNAYVYHLTTYKSEIERLSISNKENAEITGRVLRCDITGMVCNEITQVRVAPYYHPPQNMRLLVNPGTKRLYIAGGVIKAGNNQSSLELTCELCPSS